MKSLVIYASTFGNTEKIAKAIASTLRAKAVNVTDVDASEVKGADLLVVGSPINGWMPLPSITQFIDSMGPDELKNIKATSFDTRVKLFIHGDAKNKIANRLISKGATIIIKPQAFYVQGKGSDWSLSEGELEKADKFAQLIQKTVKI